MNSLEKIKRRWCAAKSNYRRDAGRAVSNFARGKLSFDEAKHIIARAEKSLRREFARAVQRAGELQIFHRQVSADLIRNLPRIPPASWSSDDPLRHALRSIARHLADALNENLEGADAGICAYEQGFLTVEWLRDGEPVTAALAHDENALAVLSWL